MAAELLPLASCCVASAPLSADWPARRQGAAAYLCAARARRQGGPIVERRPARETNSANSTLLALAEQAAASSELHLETEWNRKSTMDPLLAGRPAACWLAGWRWRNSSAQWAAPV